MQLFSQQLQAILVGMQIAAVEDLEGGCSALVKTSNGIVGMCLPPKDRMCDGSVQSLSYPERGARSCCPAVACYW